MSEPAIMTLTDAAAKHIAAILARHHDSVGFRLSVKKTGCSGYQYAPEIVHREHKEDIRVDTQHDITIFIDPKWSSVLAGTVIDLKEEDLGQKKLVYNNPNVNDECGCGESFNIDEKE